MKRYAAKKYSRFFIMYRTIVLLQPGLTMAHQGGFPDDPDVTVVPKQ
jgi:hypothetical protein